MYKDYGFYEQYGGSVCLFGLLTLIIVLVHYYFKAQINAEPIKKNWASERCKPQNILMAGFINKPPNKSVVDYTQENFTYCVQNVLKSIIGFQVNPLVYVVSLIEEVFSAFGVMMNKIRYMVSFIRNALAEITKEILGRVLNLLVPIQQIIIAFRDMMNKTTAIMVSAIYTFISVYYALISGLGSIVEFFILIIAMLLAIAAPLIAFPFTMEIGFAVLAAATAISVPFAIISATLCEVFGMCPTKNTPGLCFDMSNPIEVEDGSVKLIHQLKLGEKLKHGEKITAILKLDASNVQMYNLHGVIVSGVHRVLYKDKWVRVDTHPESKLREKNGLSPYIYCLNTTNKLIHISDLVFSDWDELYDPILERKMKDVLLQTTSTAFLKDIHCYLDGGFFGETVLSLDNGTKKEIQHILPGDVLERGIKVLGLVEIDGKTLENQYSYTFKPPCSLGEIVLQGGPNLVYYKKERILSTISLQEEKTKIDEPRDILWHLITDQHHFYVNSIKFKDYNSAVEFFF